MTTALAVIGGAVVILSAASKVPPAVSALVRACVPVVAAFHELRHAFHNPDDRSGKTSDVA